MEVKTGGWVCNGVEFNIGDTVKVVRIGVDNDPNGMGDGVAWENDWVEGRYEMDGAIGGTFEIYDIDENGVEFVDYVDDTQMARHYSFKYPLNVLEKIAG